MSAVSRTRTAVSLPLESAASSMCWIWPRPWMLATVFSERVSFHRTGVPSLRASATHSSSSAYTSSLAPNPPPTAGRDDAELVLGDAERDGDHHLEHVGDLGGGVQRDVAAERLRHGDDGARLHRHRDQALLDVALADGVGGVGRTPAGRRRRSPRRAGSTCTTSWCRVRGARAPDRTARPRGR